MAQGGIGRAAFFQGFRVYRGVIPRRPHLAVDAEQMQLPVVRGGEPRQRVVLPVGGGKGAAMHRAVEPGQLHPLHLRLCKDVYIVRPAVCGVGRLGVKVVMVAGGNEHRHGHLPQGPAERPDGLWAHPSPVQQVAGKENQIDGLFLGQPGQPGRNVPQLPPAQGALVRGQAGKGGIQVKIGGVEHLHSCPP